MDSRVDSDISSIWRERISGASYWVPLILAYCIFRALLNLLQSNPVRFPFFLIPPPSPIRLTPTKDRVHLIFLGCIWLGVDRGCGVLANGGTAGAFHSARLHDTREVLCAMFAYIPTAVPECGDTCTEDEPEDARRTAEVVVGKESVGIHLVR